ncbi:MAG TPA: hypothetical protein VNR64_13715, partial [Vicinamibacterales bacterium]|nr:hypothetical protein [Vicinamibacterales bacterium]
MELSENQNIEQTLQRRAGTLLAVGGVGFFLAGAIHPAGKPGQDFHTAIVSMLNDPAWPVAHWCALVSALLVALAFFLMIDRRESPRARTGIRLGILATAFMAVEFAVEIAARAEAAPLASGAAAPFVSLIDAMQAVGFPAFAVTFILVATGTRWTPGWVSALAVIGGAALGVGGLVVQGMHVVVLGPVFLLGNL